MDEKRFDEWNALKKKLHANIKPLIYREREIWWYSAGENIGHEINGKGIYFLRPILIVRKYGKSTFFGVPLSSRRHQGRWFSDIIVKDAIRSALLSQAGSFSTNRLHRLMDKAGTDDFKHVCEKLKELLFK